MTMNIDEALLKEVVQSGTPTREAEEFAANPAPRKRHRAVHRIVRVDGGVAGPVGNPEMV